MEMSLESFEELEETTEVVCFHFERCARKPIEFSGDLRRLLEDREQLAHSALSKKVLGPILQPIGVRVGVRVRVRVRVMVRVRVRVLEPILQSIAMDRNCQIL